MDIAVAPPSKWATKDDWITNHTLIARLYENYPLHKVMHSMETQHGFRATIKMYKTRIKQWGLNKRHQHMVITAVTNQSKIRHRVARERHSTPCPHGRVVTVGDVVQCRWCRQVVIDDIDIAQPASAPTKTMLECFTAVSTLSTTSGLLSIPERIFSTIRDYYRGSFASGTWVADQERIHCWTMKDRAGGALMVPSSRHLHAFLNESELACNLFADNYHSEAGRALMSATARIKEILQAEHPMTLSVLFELVLHVQRRNRQGIALEVLRYFSALAEILLGDQHPLRQICGWLASSVDTTFFHEVVVRCFRSAVEHLETSLGFMHRSTRESRLRYIKEGNSHENIKEGNWHENINREDFLLRKLLGEYERILGTLGFRTLDIRSSLVALYLKREEFASARRWSTRQYLVFSKLNRYRVICRHSRSGRSNSLVYDCSLQASRGRIREGNLLRADHTTNPRMEDT